MIDGLRRRGDPLHSVRGVHSTKHLEGDLAKALPHIVAFTTTSGESVEFNCLDLLCLHASLLRPTIVTL